MTKVDFEKLSRREDTKELARQLCEPGNRLEHYQKSIATIATKELELRGLEQYVRDCKDSIDRAAAEHVAACEPLQHELSNGATIARKVEVGAQINELNAAFETLKKKQERLIEAAGDQIEVVRSIVGCKVAVENAAVVCDDSAFERLKVLDKVIEMLTPITRTVSKAVEDTRVMLENERARRARGESRYNLADVERDAAFVSAVASYIGDLASKPNQEKEQIRRERLALLYQ